MVPSQSDDPEGGSGDLYPVTPPGGGPRTLSPTDISRFVRLEQCPRHLRLRLHQRAHGDRFMREAGVRGEAIRPLLTRSGRRFEDEVVEAVGRRHPVRNFSAEIDRAERTEVNGEVAAAARDLSPGETLVLIQPRLAIELDGWRIRGDADLVRLSRDTGGLLRLLVIDVKSAKAAKVDHRLQVAFYHEMLAALLAEHAVPVAEIATGVLYRPPSEPTGAEDPAELARRLEQRHAAERYFGVGDALLELVDDPDAYRSAVRDLVTGPESVANRVSEQRFVDLPFHLAYKCDGCLYNEFCMKWCAERDDLSLLPFLDGREKSALLGAGLTEVGEVARLKQPVVDPATGKEDLTRLEPAPGQAARVRSLGAAWPIGPRLDELVHRGRAYLSFKKEPVATLSYIPSKGYASLPYSAADHDPNLVRVYLDAQHDYLHDRAYLLGSLVVAAEAGRPVAARRRSVVRLAEGPPDSAETERRLFLGWIDATLRAIVELAAPDAEGQARAPIHLVFFDRYEQRVLLDGLGRHATSVLGATPLYDFVTQLAAFDSPVVSFLDEEIREFKNYPMVCQSLQAVAGYRGFDWDHGVPYRTLFKERLFDFWGKFDQPPQPDRSPWYFNRARFGSQIPLEYAYAAWDDLPPPAVGEVDHYAPYRASNRELLLGFEERRLAAIEHVAAEFVGNRDTGKRPFDLPDLDRFEQKARGLAEAMDEFLTIERHAALGAWKRARLAPPERRVVAGDSLLVRYDEADQKPEAADQNRENERRRRLKADRDAAYRAANGGAKPPRATKSEADEWRWSQEGLHVRLRFDLAGVDAGLDEVIGLTKLRPNASVVLMPRWTVDGRLPTADQVPLQPTPKQLLYATRGTLVAMPVERDESGRVVAAYAEVKLQQGRGQTDQRGYIFGPMTRTMAPGELYTIDEDPNDWLGSWMAKVTEGLRAGHGNVLVERLTGKAPDSAWPPAAAAAQARFLAGLDALERTGRLHGFEPGKRAFIGEHGATPTLLVQGPPGTGKSYTTAFALLARLQGALAADLDFRVALACKTHAATDVLVNNLAAVRAKLATLIATYPDHTAGFFDPRLFSVPIMRYRPPQEVPSGVAPLFHKDDLKGDDASSVRLIDAVAGERWCVVAAVPGGIYKAVRERWPKELFGHELFDCLVLDEASQISLPEAAMAALPLKRDGRLIIVGDHRQMAPIIKHDWANERRRTFREYRTHESLFATLLPLEPPTIRFAESFRLHGEMAEFLRREVYRHDGIPFHSRRTDLLDLAPWGDPFVDAVLDPAHPLVVVIHDEHASQTRNPFEQALLAPVLERLAAAGFDALHDLGVVVSHRAQRAALQDAMPNLTVRDPKTGELLLSAVDTVERFQGGERTAIIVSATESDPGYLLVSAGFLLDPRRLTVALSRAKQKMVLVAARSVFDLFSPDEETFVNAQLWKNLRRRTCTVPLWHGRRERVGVEVWGNEATVDPSASLEPTASVSIGSPAGGL